MATRKPTETKATDLTERPWLKGYPEGTPKGIDEAAVGTLVGLFDSAVERFANQPALESFGKRMTYAELGAHAEAVAAWLQAQPLQRGDRVAIMMPNVMAYAPVMFGILKAGLTVVNVNPLYTPRELTHQIADSGARVIFVLENFAATVEEALPTLALDKVVVVKPGNLLGLKGMLVNLVSRYVKRR